MAADLPKEFDVIVLGSGLLTDSSLIDCYFIFYSCIFSVKFY